MSTPEPNNGGAMVYAQSLITYTCGCVLVCTDTLHVEQPCPDFCVLHPMSEPCEQVTIGAEVCLS